MAVLDLYACRHRPSGVWLECPGRGSGSYVYMDLDRSCLGCGPDSLYEAVEAIGCWVHREWDHVTDRHYLTIGDMIPFDPSRDGWIGVNVSGMFTSTRSQQQAETKIAPYVRLLPLGSGSQHAVPYRDCEVVRFSLHEAPKAELRGYGKATG